MGKRTTKTQWLDLGLALLSRGGQRELTIEQLCVKMERTKGAFYHHFGDIEGYLDALFERWEQTQTEAPIARSELEVAMASAKRAALEAVIATLDHQLERVIRAWGVEDARAQAAIERVDARRIEYLASLYEVPNHAQALAIARLEYLAFVGAQQLGVWGQWEQTQAALGQALRYLEAQAAAG